MNEISPFLKGEARRQGVRDQQADYSRDTCDHGTPISYGGQAVRCDDCVTEAQVELGAAEAMREAYSAWEEREIREGRHVQQDFQISS